MQRLSDVVSASGLAGYAVVALVLFFIAFILILIPIASHGRDALYERASRMPLDDAVPDSSREPGSN